MPHTHAAVWTIGALSVVAMLSRPFRLPEWCWAVCGALALVLFGLIGSRPAGEAIARGTEVYLFLIGMMALAEIARHEGLFEWLASHAVIAARGSAFALFSIVFAIGVGVTAFLSNDATAIVLTPAVLAATRRARVTPYPFLLACAFVANAASFILPISNPANLVVFGHELPRLPTWIAIFGLPSLAAVALTFGALAWYHRAVLRETAEEHEPHDPLSTRQRIASGMLIVAAVALVVVSSLGYSVGIATFVAGAACTLLMYAADRSVLAKTVRGIEWSIIPLVAALFVIIAAIDANGGLALVRGWLSAASSLPQATQTLVVGAGIATACNLLNNLPVALLTTFATEATTSAQIQHAALIAVDLSPNLSVTGSLATLLWLAVLRREGVEYTAWQFLRVGGFVTVPALAAALLLLLRPA